MISGIREFYSSISKEVTAENDERDMMTEKEFIGKWYPRLKKEGINQKLFCKVFGHDRKTLEAWGERFS